MAIKIPQVRENPIASTSGVRTPDADAFGHSIGAANVQVGKVIGEIGLTLQNQRNESMARETDTWYEQRLNDLRNGYAQQNGKAAYESQQDYDKAVADLRREAMGRLENDAQRRMFEPVANRKQLAANQFGSLHAIKSLKQWQIETIGSQAESNAKLAIDNYGTPQGQMSIDQMMENIDDLGYEQGWPPERIQAEKDARMSSIVQTRIQSILVDDPRGAAQVLADDGDLIDPKVRAQVQKQVDAYVDKEVAMDTADALLSQVGSDYEAAWDLAKQIEDREQRLEVQRIIKDEISIKRTFEKEREKDKHDREWNRLFQLDRPTMKDLPPEGLVTPAVRGQMIKYIKNERRVTNDDVLFNELLDEATEDPKAFKERDLSEYNADISPDKMKSLRKLQKGDEKETNVRTTTSELYKRAEAAADIGKNSKQASAKLRGMIDRSLLEATEAKGKPLNANEQMDVVNQQVYQYKIDAFKSKSKLKQWFSTGPLEFESNGEQWDPALVHKVINDHIINEDEVPDRETIQSKLDEMAKRYTR